MSDSGPALWLPLEAPARPANHPHGALGGGGGGAGGGGTGSQHPPSPAPACCCSPDAAPALTSRLTRALAAPQRRLAGSAAEQAAPACSPSCTGLGLDLDLPVLLRTMGARSQPGAGGLHGGTCERAWQGGFSFSQNNPRLVCTCGLAGGSGCVAAGRALPRQPLRSRSQRPPARRSEGRPRHGPQGHPAVCPPFPGGVSPRRVPGRAGRSRRRESRAPQSLLRSQLCCSVWAPEPSGR